MDVDRLRGLLEEVRGRTLPIEDALNRLRDLPYEDLEFAKLDHHRTLRTGFPEVIYCPGKSVDQITSIAGRLRERSAKVLATRATDEVAAALTSAFEGTVHHQTARMVVVPGSNTGAPLNRQPCSLTSQPAKVLIIAAGTSDIPVAEEAAVTASEMGSTVERLYDVGVAGLHRLLDRKETLFSASVLIVVAGMEGALPSVVGGLVSRPVIAVPTSVGYGASFDGLAALLAMLNCCASGVAVMNIDNGFGAGYFAHMIVAGQQSVPSK